MNSVKMVNGMSESGQPCLGGRDQDPHREAPRLTGWVYVVVGDSLGMIKSVICICSRSCLRKRFISRVNYRYVFRQRRL